MSVHRLAKYQTDDPFTRVPNSAINDDRLDLKSRGLLLLMLSKPDGWVFRERHLAQIAGVGRDALRAAMQTLIQTGYVVRTQESADGKPPVCVTRVYDMPQHARVGLPEVGFSDRGETRPLSNEGVLVTKEISKPPRQSAMTDEWQPDPDNLQQIRQRHPNVNVNVELANFRDHWIGKGERRASWNATLRTWMRNAEKWTKATAPDHKPPTRAAPDQCPDCYQPLATHDSQVHDLLKDSM